MDMFQISRKIEVLRSERAKLNTASNAVFEAYKIAEKDSHELHFNAESFTYLENRIDEIDKKVRRLLKKLGKIS